MRRSNPAWEVWKGCLEEEARAKSWGHPGDLDTGTGQGGLGECWAFGTQILTKGKRLWGAGGGKYRQRMLAHAETCGCGQWRLFLSKMRDGITQKSLKKQFQVPQQRGLGPG